MASARKAWRRGGCRWEIAPAWSGAAGLARRLKTSPLIAQVLHNRGLEDPQDVHRFLFPKLTDLHPPHLLAGVDAAAERLCRAVRQRERVCIYGDYDVDGMTGLAILYRCLAMHDAEVDYYVPHRLEEGYGVNAEAVEKIAAAGTRLMITVDCGITAVGPLGRARQLGMDVILTDHHAPGPAPPSPAPSAPGELVAVVHPGLPGANGGAYPNGDLSGAGVALKLAWQFARRMSGGGGDGADRVDEPTRKLLLEATSLAALGTIADVVPLVGENRVLAVFGLKGLTAIEHAGVRALLASARLTGERLNAYHVGFCLAPRLNACGRMGHARAAVELLARAEPQRAQRIAEKLERLNAQRQRIERQIFEEAAEMVESGPRAGVSDSAIVLASPGWHAGVVGIVASRLVDRFHRPAVVIALEGEQGKGSGRSIEGLHMRDALAACAEHLGSFGGHAMAGGLRLAARNVEAFAEAFARHAAERLGPEALRPVLRIDAVVTLAELSLPVVEHLERLAPFGPGNPRPLVAIRSCRVITPPRRMGRGGATVSLLIGQDSRRLRCVGFNMGELADRLVGVNTVDVVGQPALNRFGRRTSAEMHLRDVVWG